MGGPSRRPLTCRRPQVLHGTGGTKEQMLPILTRYANNNYLACSIDSRYHGQRGSPREYSAALIEAYRANSAGEVGAECDSRPAPPSLSVR